MKILIGIVFVAVIFSLGSALFHMTSRNRVPAEVTRSFVWRIGFSALLILLLVVGSHFGVLE